MNFLEWEAVSAFGGTIQEMYDWEMGKYPVWLKEKTIAWYLLHNQVEMHKQDAVNKKSKR